MGFDFDLEKVFRTNSKAKEGVLALKYKRGLHFKKEKRFFIFYNKMEGKKDSLPAIEGRQVRNVPNIGRLLDLKEHSHTEDEERHAPGEDAVLEVGRRIVASRDRGDGGVKMMTHRGQPANHRHAKVLQTQPQGNAQLRIL